MGRHAARRAANAANRSIGINAAAWFAGQSFTSAHRDPAPRETFDEMDARIKAEVRRDEIDEGIVPNPVSPLRDKDADGKDSFDRQREYHAELSKAVEHLEPPILTCAQCGRKVYTLVEGNCFYCGRPVEGKNLAEMSATQANAMHGCGIKNRSHCDGWDGNWLNCEEAARRMGR